MKNLFKIVLIVLSLLISISAQGFDVKASGSQTFSFEDSTGRNQASFHSYTPFEEVNGLTTQIHGKVSFDVKNFSNTLQGTISIPVASLKTGIEKMERDLRSSAWLNAERYPDISFKIIKVDSIQKLSPNKLAANVTGDFSLHGVTKQISANATITYLDENEETEKRMPGDLLGVVASFSIKLSDYGVEHMLLGKKVSNNIDIKVNLVGTNKF
jgi:polyisoprenoid-binding protein YceI